MKIKYSKREECLNTFIWMLYYWNIGPVTDKETGIRIFGVEFILRGE